MWVDNVGEEGSASLISVSNEVDVDMGLSELGEVGE